MQAKSQLCVWPPNSTSKNWEINVKVWPCKHQWTSLTHQAYIHENINLRVINNNITRSSGCSNHYWFLYHLYQLTTFCDMLWAIDLGSTIQWSSSQSLSLVFSGKHSSFTVPAQQLSKTAFLRWPKAEREWCQHTRKILERIVMLYCPHQICGFEMCFRIWMWLCDVNVVFSLSADSLLWLQPWNPWLGAQVLHDASRRFVVQAEGWSTSQCVGLSCLIHVAICIDMLWSGYILIYNDI